IRVPGGELHVRPPTAPGPSPGVRPDPRLGGASSAGPGDGLRRAQSGRGARTGLLSADVRASGGGAGRRRVLPAADHDVVPARGEAARMKPSKTLADTRS